jgi:hypothetical protein
MYQNQTPNPRDTLIKKMIIKKGGDDNVVKRVEENKYIKILAGKDYIVF